MIIESCRFAAMKCWGFGNILQKRCITETTVIREDGTIECIVHDAAHPSKRKSHGINSKVDLKYINKKQNIYLIIKGLVTQVDKVFHETLDKKSGKDQTVYTIKILEAELFERRYFSGSTSLLLRKKKQQFILPAA